MSSRQARESGDRTTRARIRDSAIRVFATRGFAATVRDVADAAGVSAGLVIHHFGSKTGLRTECDDVVVATLTSEKALLIGPGAEFEAYLDNLQTDPHAQTRVLYLLRAVAEGGDIARTVLERSITHARTSLQTGVEAGTYRPSRDEEARARYIAYIAIGALVMDITRHPPVDWSDPVTILRGYIDRTALPALEYGTQGLGIDPGMVDAYLRQRSTEPTQGDPR